QWRRFTFFNKQSIPATTSGRSWETLRNIEITCSTCGRGSLIFGDILCSRFHGLVHIVNHNFQVSTFKAFEITLLHLFQLKLHNVLAAVGIDETGINPVIKVWNMDKRDKNGNPFCGRVQSTIPANNQPSMVTSFCVHENQALMAVGFAMGSVALYKGDIAKDSQNKTIHLSIESDARITGLSFHGVGKSSHLFATTEDLVVSFNLQDKVPKKNILDHRGCQVLCSTLSDTAMDHQFIVASTDAVYAYQPDARGPAFAFEGEKWMAKWFNGYLVVVYKDKGRSSVPSSRWVGWKVGGSNPARLFPWLSLMIPTIGRLEPSYIIRKFLDAQQIRNLTFYLQAMHERGLANEDHTTLLLNCFTKLKDVDNLNKFIMTPETELHFDVETAIRVCRQAGYYEHALQLAEKHHKHKWYLKIQLEDTHQHRKALAYIRQLPFNEAENSVKRYGKALVTHVPEETTDLLKLLCTDYQPSKPTNPQLSTRSVSKSNGVDFIHIFVNSPDMLVKFLEHLIKVQDNAPETVYNTLLELYLQKLANPNEIKSNSELESLALNLLKEISVKRYDTDQALLLCQMNDFRPGILFLYQACKLYQQILRYHMDHEAHGLVVDTCRRYGGEDGALWQQALTYFAKQQGHHATNETIGSLTSHPHIEKHNLLPPLLVVQLLSKNSTVTLGVVRDYILRRIRQESDEIENCEKSIADYQVETQEMKNKIEQLKTGATIFQETRCSLCSFELELPTLHFLCQHAFHVHCFESYADNESECPVCLPKNQKILENLREQEQVGIMALHEQFNNQLKRSSDGFSIIADYFSKGVFNKVTLLTDGDSSKPPIGGPRSHGIDPGLQKELLMMQQAN
uniref:Vacuolar protein sorting-associated protein 11 homolog n=1 Tax=Ciona savignyi TaxID=51511 RepID=H2ZAB7_CIOSA